MAITAKKRTNTGKTGKSLRASPRPKSSIAGAKSRAKKKTGNTVKKSRSAADAKAIASRKKRQKSAKQVKQGVQSALYGIYAISMIFALLIVFSLAFLLYQWKELQITEYVKQNQRLQAEVLKLKSEKNLKQGYINTELETYYRIAMIASEKLGLRPPLPAEVPKVIDVDKAQLSYYGRKDKETQAHAQ